jgi:hypothetical protein
VERKTPASESGRYPREKNKKGGINPPLQNAKKELKGERRKIQREKRAAGCLGVWRAGMVRTCQK